MKQPEVMANAVMRRAESSQTGSDTLLLLCNDLLLCLAQPAIAAAQGKHGTLQAAHLALTRRRRQTPPDP